MKKAMNKITVIYIDDEVENLKAFKAAFRRDFTILLCENTTEAMELIEKNDVHILVSDHKMPNESGLVFFEKVTKTHPQIIRILITAYGDFKLVQESINKGNVYRFINKPWDEKFLKTTLEDAGNVALLNRKNESLKKAYFQLFDENPNFLIIVNQEDSKIVTINKATQNLLSDYNSSYTEQSIDEVLGKTIDKSKPTTIRLYWKNTTLDLQFIPKELTFDDKKHILFTIIDLSALLEKERQRERLIAEIQQQERNHLAMEIHDGIGQEIVVLKLAAENLLHNSDASNNKANETFILGIQEVLKKVRSLSYHLAPPEIENGLLNGIKTLVSKIKAVSKINFIIKTTPEDEEHFTKLNLSQEVNYQLYRVFQEFINNSIQHANASEIEISLTSFSKQITLVFKDNGLGFDTEKSSSGNGLKNMASRLKSNNVDYKLISELGKGTKLLLEFNKNSTPRE
jgi:signal transduction histidine kinase